MSYIMKSDYHINQTNLFGDYVNTNRNRPLRSEINKMAQPVKKFRAGQITATVWENVKKVNNEEQTFFSTNIEKNYKDSEGNWKTTNSFQVNDLPRVALVSEQTFEYLVLKDVDTSVKKE